MQTFERLYAAVSAYGLPPIIHETAHQDHLWGANLAASMIDHKWTIQPSKKNHSRPASKNCIAAMNNLP